MNSKNKLNSASCRVAWMPPWFNRFDGQSVDQNFWSCRNNKTSVFEKVKTEHGTLNNGHNLHGDRADR